jgi:transcriptional regulator with XRE-family HTH domain
MSRTEFVLDFATTSVQLAQSELDLTIEETARVLGVDRKTIMRWLKGESTPSLEHRKLLEQLNQIRYLMDNSFRSHEARQRWLHAPAPGLKGKTPYAALTDGTLDAVFRLLGTLAAGAFR